MVYAFLIVSLRLSGKRELVQLNPFDLVVLLTLSNTVQNAIIGDDNSVTGGIIGATSLLLVNYLVVRFLYNHRKLDQLVEGKADILIENGKVNTHHLKNELITMAQLEAAARKQGFESIGGTRNCLTTCKGCKRSSRLCAAGVRRPVHSNAQLMEQVAGYAKINAANSNGQAQGIRN